MNLEELTKKYIDITQCDGKTFYKVKKIAFCEKEFYNVVKRIFDICASTIAALMLAIPMLVIALLVKADSKGSAIYKQERLGKNGQTFMIYKFRTMHIDAEKDGAKWAEIDDDRCTRIGGFLRKSRLDELPQLFNILKGEMSVIGPRPERECFYKEFEEYIDGFSQRLYVLPGLSGLAQLNDRKISTPEQKIPFDIEYIEQRSFWFDIKIIFMTPKMMFGSKEKNNR